MLTWPQAFQEARLSQRCLFFTSDQVYFACTSVLRSEDVSQTAPDRPLGNEYLNPSIMKFKESFPGNRNEVFHRHVTNLLEDIQQYTTRTLTYESDALKAFLGVLSASGSPSIWGVPAGWIGANLTAPEAFTIALLWSPLYEDPSYGRPREAGVREGFPTWSWLGYAGRVEYAAWRLGSLLKRKDFIHAEFSIPGLDGGIDVAACLNQQEFARELELSSKTLLLIKSFVSWVLVGVFSKGQGPVAHEAYKFRGKIKECYSREPVQSVSGSVVLDRKSGFCDGPRAAVRMTDSYYTFDQHGFGIEQGGYWLLVERRGLFFIRIGLMRCSKSQEAELLSSPWTQHRVIGLI